MKKLSILLLVLAFAGGAMAQTSAAHTVNVTLSFFNIIKFFAADPTVDLLIDETGITAGEQPAPATDNEQYLQYTVITALASPRKITAQITTGGDMPSGVTLEVESGVPGGVGDPGGSAGKITLVSTEARDLITSIGSCYTGTLATDGAQLTYTATSDGTAVEQAIIKVVTYTFAAG